MQPRSSARFEAGASYFNVKQQQQQEDFKVAKQQQSSLQLHRQSKQVLASHVASHCGWGLLAHWDILHVSWFLTTTILLFGWKTEPGSLTMQSVWQKIFFTCGTGFIPFLVNVWECQNLQTTSLYLTVKTKDSWFSPSVPLLSLEPRKTLRKICLSKCKYLSLPPCCGFYLYFFVISLLSFSFCPVVLQTSIALVWLKSFSSFLYFSLPSVFPRFCCLFYFLVSLKAVITLIWKVLNKMLNIVVVTK